MTSKGRVTFLFILTFCLSLGADMAHASPLASVSSDHIEMLARSLRQPANRVAYLVVRNKAYSISDLEQRLARKLYGDEHDLYIVDGFQLGTEESATSIQRFIKRHHRFGALIAVNGLTNSKAHQIFLLKLQQEILAAHDDRAHTSIDLSPFTFLFSGEQDFSLGSTREISTAELRPHASLSAFEPQRLSYYVLPKATLDSVLQCEERLVRQTRPINW